MAKDRGLKNRTPIANAIDTGLYLRLKKYSEESMIPMSKILDRAIEEYLDKVDRK